MKILVNGYAVTENLKSRLNRRSDDISIAEKVLNYLQRNKCMYAKLVLITALIIHFNINVYANTLEASLDSVGNQLIDMLASVAKWACIGMGIKNMSATLLNGGSLKRASTEGIQYLLGYLFIQFYPQLFDLFGKIKIK